MSRALAQARYDASIGVIILTGKGSQAFCSDVERAVVVPIPHARFGQRPVAFIYPFGEHTLERLSQHVRQHLPGYLCPDALLAWPDPSVFKPPLAVWTQLAERACASI